MKLLSAIFALLLFSNVTAQEHRLELVWQTDTVIAVPESVLPDHSRKVLFLSLIDGAPWAADGKGGVAKLGFDGKQYEASWITGLHAPKGMGIHGNRLYVADITELVIIDIQNGKVEKKLAIDSARGLNDVTIAANGIVFVSDSRTGRIWMVENDIAKLYMDSLPGLNGLKIIGDDLYIAAGKSFIRSDAQKRTTRIAELPQGGDGIEPIGNGDFLVTSWGGYVFYVHADGKVETLLDTHLEKRNTADIGYDPATRIVYVPTFNAKTIAAYRLK